MESASTLVNATRQRDVKTKNGMTTNSTSLNSCVDFFFIAGASRTMSEKDIKSLFAAAFAEDSTIATKLIFWARDCRGGSGERRIFHVCFSYLLDFYPAVAENVITHIPEYGTWKDIFPYALNNDVAFNYVLSSLKSHISSEKPDGLLCKWLSRKGPLFNKLRISLNITPKELRKVLVEGSKTVEQQMCAKDWSGIKYSGVPSVAMNNYRKAFFKRDEERFKNFIEDVKSGKQKMNASVLFPHLLVEALKPYNKQDQYNRNTYFLTTRETDANVINAIDAQWSQLPNYLEGSTEKILPVCDISQSMENNNSLPMNVSVAMGIYVSERNQSIFKDAFVTFSNKAKMHYLKGTLSEKIRQISEDNMSTNLESVFNLLLDKAVENNVAAEHMPTKLVIISDMEFNAISGNPSATAMDMIRDKYANAGYEVPGIVFWNVNGRKENNPVKFDEKGTGLISGFEPSILKSVLGGEITPVSIMMKAIGGERYEKIS